MSILTSTRPEHFDSLPHPTPPVRRVATPEPEPGHGSGPADGPLLGTLADVTELAGQANQTTVFATWTVATMGIGLMFVLDRVQTARLPVAVLLLGLLLPILAAAGQTVLLLSRAGAAGAAVGGVPRWSAGASADRPPSVHQVWDRLHLATAALQCRELLARRAAVWAGAAGLGFLAWSLLTMALTRGT